MPRQAIILASTGDRGSFRWQGASGPAVASPFWLVPEEAVPNRLAVEPRLKQHRSALGKYVSRASVELPKGRLEKPIVGFCQLQSEHRRERLSGARGEVEKTSRPSVPDRGGARFLLYFRINRDYIMISNY